MAVLNSHFTPQHLYKIHQKAKKNKLERGLPTNHFHSFGELPCRTSMKTHLDGPKGEEIHSSYNLAQAKQRRMREKPTYLINLGTKPTGEHSRPSQ